MADGGTTLAIILMAMFGLPKLMSILPDFDPLMLIVGIFLIMAVVQQLGFQGGDPNGTTAASRQRARQRHAAGGKDEHEDNSSKDVDVKQLLEDAERALQQNNWSRVQELARKATDADPECARAWELLATAQKWEGKREDAAATVRKAQDIYEVESEGLKKLARELENSKPSAAMVAEFDKKGEDFFSRRQYDLAAECFAKALEAIGDAPASDAEKVQRKRMLQGQANCAQQLQDWGTCRQATTELLQADPRDARALLQRAASNEALEKFKAALDDARKLLAIDPKSAAGNRIVHNCQQALRD